MYIIAWIMDRWAAYSPSAFNLLLIALILPSCDELQLDGKPKPSNVSRSGYQHAQKMRASMTHIFGRDFELGSASWVKDSRTGQTYGNPSVSQKVATYMVSLRNRKASVHCCVVFTFLTTSIDTSWGPGEVATSARAITSVIQSTFPSRKQVYIGSVIRGS